MIVHTRQRESCQRSAADNSGAARGSVLDKRKSGSNGGNRKWPLFEMVKGMRAQGMRAFEIVKATGISRGRVDKWLRLDECPPQGKMAPRPGMAESFREELRQRWDQGCQNGKHLFAEMRQRGYIGSYTGHVSPQEAAALLSKPRTMLNERQTKIVEVLKRNSRIRHDAALDIELS